ncbi:MAG: DNA cytosine methyltransferase [Victivallales bacterium]|nr:DNA cytosine methyltransferase [Victivallales bacterium]
MPFTFIDLFAGIGGIRLPFDELGGNCVFSSE